MRDHARDGVQRNEVVQRDNQPTGPVKMPYRGATETKRATDREGINKMIPVTNNTKAPGQYGRS